MTEQEREDIQEALDFMTEEVEVAEGAKKDGFSVSDAYLYAHRKSVKALRRWLDVDREDREHDES